MEEKKLRIHGTSDISLQRTVETPNEMEFLDMNSIFQNSPTKNSNQEMFHDICTDDIEPIQTIPSNGEGKIFSPLRVIYSPSKFFKSPMNKNGNTELLHTPNVSKKSTTTSSIHDSSHLLSPFSEWKVDHTEKHQYRFALSPIPLISTPRNGNDDDNHNFLTFAQSLPAITDLNNLDSSPSVTISPLTPEQSLTKLNPGIISTRERTPDTDTECPKIIQRLEFNDTPKSNQDHSYPMIQTLTSHTPGKFHRLNGIQKSIKLHVNHSIGFQSKDIKIINESMRKEKSIKLNKNSKAIKTLILDDITTTPTTISIPSNTLKRSIIENINDTPSTTTKIILKKKKLLKKNPCNCKKSQCLKLYCECFASGTYCDENCKCYGCYNTIKNDIQRNEAIHLTLERNPNAFQSKIKIKKFEIHQNGCHCKKSFCQKKYCECYQAGISCGENCKCIDCKNQNGICNKKNYKIKPILIDTIQQFNENENKKIKLIVYPLFGPTIPPIMKNISSIIFQYLDGPDIYNASIVNHLWNGMIMNSNVWDYTKLKKI